MFALATFLFACIGLVLMFMLQKREHAQGVRFAPRFRNRLDVYADHLFVWMERNATPEALWSWCARMMNIMTHYCARAMARIAHSVEFQARTVVHKTSKRVRREMHYLEEVIESKLDSEEKKGNNTASEKSD